MNLPDGSLGHLKLCIRRMCRIQGILQGFFQRSNTVRDIGQEYLLFH
jgi:hypothetical protein